MIIRVVWAVVLTLAAPAAVAEPRWKVRIDPLLALANYPNLEVDRALTPSVSVGAMAWHHSGDWVSDGETRSSFGVRIDWYDRTVFSSGWHSNLILKSDWKGGAADRFRLKGTQTYQWAWDRFFVNAGIGVQFLTGTESASYYDYESWVVPAWEVSVGRSF